MNFRTLPASRRPNRWLICPPGFANREPDEVPPVYGVEADQLREQWSKLIRSQPRIRIDRDEPDGMDLVQRTAILRFADDIGVAYVPLGPGRSSIALFSRSRIGYSDLGVNRRRLRGWIGALNESLPVLRSAKDASQ